MRRRYLLGWVLLGASACGAGKNDNLGETGTTRPSIVAGAGGSDGSIAGRGGSSSEQGGATQTAGASGSAGVAGKGVGAGGGSAVQGAGGAGGSVVGEGVGGAGDGSGDVGGGANAGGAGHGAGVGGKGVGGSGAAGSSAKGGFGGQLGCWEAPTSCNPASVNAGPVHGLAVGDVNGDGRLDAVVLSGGLTAVFGNGDGTFTVGPTSVGVGASVNLGDLDGDGTLDAVVSTFGSSVSIFHGKGDGTFAAGTVIPEEPQDVSAITLGDFDGDGLLDVAGTSGAGVVVRFQKSGALGLFVPVAPCGEGNDLSAADLNGDGVLDLLGVCGNAATSFLGKGDGTFAVGPTLSVDSLSLPDEARMALGDLTGDGTVDAVMNGTVLLGHGDGSFSLAPMGSLEELPGPPGDGTPTTALADLDEDGRLDFAFPDMEKGVLVFPGVGDGTWGAPLDYPAWGYPQSVRAGDVNGDGRADIVLVTGDGTVSAVLAGTTPLPVTPASVIAVAVGDLDADGHLDVVGILNVSGGNTFVFRGHGDGTFDAPAAFTTGGDEASAVAVADFNGDGRLDVIVGVFSGGPPGELRVLLGDGQGSLSGAAIVTPIAGSARRIVVDHMNGDAVWDVAIADYYAEQSQVFFGKGDASFASGPSISVKDPEQVATADFNGDGFEDLASSGNLSAVLVAYGDGTGAFSKPSPVDSLDGSEGVWLAAGDMDLDGFADLVTASPPGGLFVHRGSASGLLPAQMSLIPGGAADVDLADLDGDGYRDIVAFSGQIPALGMALLRGHGDGTFDPPIFQLAGAVPSTIATGDFDEDGHIDLVISTSDGVLFLHNPWP